MDIIYRMSGHGPQLRHPST